MHKYILKFAYMQKKQYFCSMNILLTGVGAPGVQGTLYALRELKGRIIGTDVDEMAVGKYLCDDFAPIARASEKEKYLSDIMRLCREKKVDCIVPQNTAELPILAEHLTDFLNIGTKIVVSSKQSIECANNKYRLLCKARELNILTGEFSICTNFDDLCEQVKLRQDAGLLTVVKPPCGNGSRGVRIIIQSDKRDRKEDFYNTKPSSLYCTLEELHTVLGEEFPELLVMDFLPGDEYTVDVLRTEDQFVVLPRKREKMRSGITFQASLERNESIIKASKQLSEALDLRFCFGFQFKKNAEGRPALLECNPRVQGTMVMSAMAGANIIAEAVRNCLQLQPRTMNIDWSTRLVRYWGAVGVNETGVVKI